MGGHPHLTAIALVFWLVSKADTSHETRAAWAALDGGTQKLLIQDGKPQKADTESKHVPVAWGTFRNDINETGWSYLQVESNERVPDELQAYAAGAVEAHLTRNLMEYQWINMFGRYCENRTTYCDKLSKFFTKNLKYSQEKQHLLRKNDSFWNMVHLQMKQLAGLSDAFENKQLDFSSEVSSATRVVYLNALADIQDLENVLGRKRNFYTIDKILACSALVKIIGNFEDLYFAHTTWFLYKAMLRVQKKYILPWHQTASKTTPEDVVPGHTMTITTYPGMLISWDSYYLTSAGLAITETQLLNHNADLNELVTSTGGIMGWIRAAVASRLSTTAEEWVLTMSKENSGTANSQNLVLDYKLFRPGAPIVNGTLWMREQMPGIVHYGDLSARLREQKYWPGYNVAYFDDIFEISGQPAKVKEYGDYYTYENCPRAKLFRRDHTKLKDLDSVTAYMRYNDYKNDPLSRCNCTPPYNPTFAISARNDLLCPWGKYDAPGMNRQAVGGIDTKVTNQDLFASSEFVAISGPTWEMLPPFQWSTSGLPDIHVGHPDKWQFGPVLHKWDESRAATPAPQNLRISEIVRVLSSLQAQ
ncbi:putative phospholipase B-like 2 [Dermacentor variabilis]|uniref:putative phospholipase B-like 2 n=1 Tax=Dermacentor variabilis TaxID=34621 RepID=UPI003F5C1505